MKDIEHRLAQIEGSIEAQDFDAARQAAEKLLPLLQQAETAQWVSCRDRLKQMTIGVKAVQKRQTGKLRELRQQQGGVAAYRAMQS